MINGWVLCARARHTFRTLVAVFALGFVEFLVGSSSHLIDSETRTFAIPWAVVLPVATATMIGVGTRSAVGDLEGTAIRSLPGLRVAHLTINLMVASLATAVGSARIVFDPNSQLSGPAALRNLLVFTGLSLISAALLGSSWAWPLPLSLAIASTTVGTAAGAPQWWAVPIRPDGDPLAAALSAAVLAAGVAMVVARGTREPSAEQD